MLLESLFGQVESGALGRQAAAAAGLGYMVERAG
jgi:hypothetical protein